MPSTPPPGPRRLGKLRRLQRISDARGFVRVAAIDHPENYLALFDDDLDTVSHREVVESKLELVAAMSTAATAVLVDPIWSFGQSVLTGAVPPGVGIISGLEHLAYSPTGFGTETVLRERWTVPLLSRLGADGAKLVVFHRSERSRVSRSQYELVEELAARCDEAEIPLVVEPLWYPLDGESLDDPAVRSARTEAIVESAARFADLGADLMKLEFPGGPDDTDDRQAAADACRRIDDSIDVPWVLLSSSATFPQFRAQLGVAAAEGACGFMAGRAIWGDAVGRHDAATRAAGARMAVERLQELEAVLVEHGQGWFTPASHRESTHLLSPTWHETYAGAR